MCAWQELEATAQRRDSQVQDQQASAASALAQHDAAVATLQERLAAAEAGSAKLCNEVSAPCLLPASVHGQGWPEAASVLPLRVASCQPQALLCRAGL